MAWRNISPEVRDQIGHDAYRKFRHDMAISDMDNTLRFARLRCLSFEELLRRLKRIWEDPEHSGVIAALAERELSTGQEKKLVQLLIGLSQVGDQLDTKSKRRVDRTLARVARLLSPEAACKLVGPFLDHRRKARRAIACRVFRSVPPTGELAQKLVEKYRQTGEEEFLEVVARSTQAVARVDVTYLLSSISEKYWRARVLAALLIAEPRRAYRFASDYPCEFVHAVGRVRHKDAIKILKGLFKKHRREIEFLSIYAWCLGVLRARKDLAAVEGAFADFKRRLPKGSPSSGAVRT